MRSTAIDLATRHAASGGSARGPRGYRATSLCSALVLGLVLAWVASPVAAQDAERTAVARSLFRQGVELSDQGRWDEAADHFRRSLSLRDSPVVAFNFGTALVRIGRLVEATEHFRRAARDPEAPERLREAARQQVEALQPRLGRLALEVEGPIETVELQLDGDPVALERVGVTAPADPGSHVLRALRADEEVARGEVEVPEGGLATVRLVVPPPPAADPAQVVVTGPFPRGGTGERELPPPHDDTLTWVGVVVGVVALVGAAAAVTTVVALDAQGPPPPIQGNLGPAVIVFE